MRGIVVGGRIHGILAPQRDGAVVLVLVDRDEVARYAGDVEARGPNRLEDRVQLGLRAEVVEGVDVERGGQVVRAGGGDVGEGRAAEEVVAAQGARRSRPRGARVAAELAEVGHPFDGDERRRGQVGRCVGCEV